MKSARAARDLRDQRGPSVGEASLPRGRRRAIARDASEFVGLLAKTFYGLPADVIAASIAINLLGLALPLAILRSTIGSFHTQPRPPCCSSYSAYALLWFSKGSCASRGVK